MSKRREVGSSNPPSYIDTTLPPQFNLALIRQHSRHRIETNNRLLFQSAYGKSRSLFDDGAVIETAGADVIDRHGPGEAFIEHAHQAFCLIKIGGMTTKQRTVGKGNDKFWKSMEDVQARTTPGLLKPVNNPCDVEVERQLLRRPVGKNKNINSILNLYLDTFGQQPYGKDLEISWIIEQVYRQKELYEKSIPLAQESYEERREDNDRIVHRGRIDMTDSDIHSWGNQAFDLDSPRIFTDTSMLRLPSRQLLNVVFIFSELEAGAKDAIVPDKYQIQQWCEEHDEARSGTTNSDKGDQSPSEAASAGAEKTGSEAKDTK